MKFAAKLLLVAATVCGCSQAPPASADPDFRFVPPAEWRPASVSPGSAFFSGPNGQIVSFSAYPSRGHSLKAFDLVVRETTRKVHRVLISDSPTTICARIPAKHQTIMDATRSGKASVNEYVVAVWNARVYQATYSYPSGIKPSASARRSLQTICPRTV